MSDSTDDGGEDAGQQYIQLTDIGADPTVSIAIDETWIQWLLEQPIPSNVEGIDESISDFEDSPNV
jgi:hypothetical protein